MSLFPRSPWHLLTNHCTPVLGKVLFSCGGTPSSKSPPQHPSPLRRIHVSRPSSDNFSVTRTIVQGGARTEVVELQMGTFGTGSPGTESRTETLKPLVQEPKLEPYLCIDMRKKSILWSMRNPAGASPPAKIASSLSKNRTSSPFGVFPQFSSIFCALQDLERKGPFGDEKNK